MPIVDVPQGRVHYRVAGPAESTQPTVVFVHGLLVNAELWTGVADRLAAQGIRSYAPHLPLGAHPEALRSDTDLTPQGVARLINDVLAALDLTDVTLVGNDTGGALCQFLIDADASRVGRLVLTNCDAFDQFPPAPFGLLVAAGRKPGRLRALMAPMRSRALRHSWLGFGGLMSKPRDAALTRRWVEPVLTDRDVRRDAARFMAQVRPADLQDVSTRLGRFGKPVTLVWGQSDKFFKPALADRLQAAFGAATIVPVPGARTFVALDDPDAVAREIAVVGRAHPGVAR